MTEFWVYVPGNGGSITTMNGFATEEEAKKYLDEVPERKAAVKKQIEEISAALSKLYEELAAL